jgi:hypothetical protein
MARKTASKKKAVNVCRQGAFDSIAISNEVRDWREEVRGDKSAFGHRPGTRLSWVNEEVIFLPTVFGELDARVQITYTPDTIARCVIAVELLRAVVGAVVIAFKHVIIADSIHEAIEIANKTFKQKSKLKRSLNADVRYALASLAEEFTVA